MKDVVTRTSMLHVLRSMCEPLYETWQTCLLSSTDHKPRFLRHSIWFVLPFRESHLLYNIRFNSLDRKTEVRPSSSFCCTALSKLRLSAWMSATCTHSQKPLHAVVGPPSVLTPLISTSYSLVFPSSSKSKASSFKHVPPRGARIFVTRFWDLLTAATWWMNAIF